MSETSGHTLAGTGASYGLSMNFEAVAARYVDMQLERKIEALYAYHNAVDKTGPTTKDKETPTTCK